MLDKFIKDRYKSWDGAFGKKIEDGKTTFDEVAACPRALVEIS